MSADVAATADVAIIGGGPAGCAAALTLRRYTALSVCVIERGHYDRDRVGESISPGLLPVLDYLGVGEAFRAADFPPSYAFTAAWGSPEVQDRDFVFSPQGHGWHLDRRRFDAGMAQAVEAHGAQVLDGCRVIDAKRHADAWHVAIDGDAGKQALTCRYLIDCSGRSSYLSRHTRSKPERVDSLVGLAAYVANKGAPTASVTLVETVPEGWWYTAPVPGDRIACILMTDADLVRRHELNKHAGWTACLRQAPHTGQRLQDGQVGPLQAWPTHTQWLPRATGPGWIAAGESAAAFDPLAAMGIGHAISSGCQAARHVAAILEHDDHSGLAHYQADLDRHIAHYLERKQAYYRVEQRFAEHVFWQRRQRDQAPAARSRA